MNKSEGKLSLFRESQKIQAGIKSDHASLLSKDILRALIAIVNAYNAIKDVGFMALTDVVLNISFNNDINNPKYIINNLGIILYYQPNYKKQCFELTDISFVDKNRYTLGYSIKKFICELNCGGG